MSADTYSNAAHQYLETKICYVFNATPHISISQSYYNLKKLNI